LENEGTSGGRWVGRGNVKIEEGRVTVGVCGREAEFRNVDVVKCSVRGAGKNRNDEMGRKVVS